MNTPFRALITGASQGIGASLAKNLAKRGSALLLVARSESKLQEVANQCRELGATEVKVLALDLSLEPSWKLAAEAGIQFNINMLINNAGYGLWGNFDALDLSELQKNMRLNMDAVWTITKLLLPTLKAKTPSYIMNVASTTAYQAIPTFANYAASKSFVLLWSRALHHELEGSGVQVTALVPGATDTQFIDRAGMHHMEKAAKKMSMTPDEVAQIGIEGLLRGKIEVVPGFANRFSAYSVPLLPKSWVEKIAGSIYTKKN